MDTSKNIQYMSRAIQLAKKGQYTTHPNPRVGCVIVKNDQIIGESFHQVAGEPHAEINALNSLDNIISAKGATAYVTLEPCSHTGKTPPCANALIDAKVTCVVIAMQDPNPQVAGKGIQKLKDAGIKVTIGVLEEQAKKLNLGFIKRMEKDQPWVRIKMAMSLDGRTAMASGESQWITGADARQDVQRLRAKADVILTGIGTVIEDDPSLNVRTSASDLDISHALFKKYKQATRVVLDSQFRISPQAKLLHLKDAADVLIYTCVENPKKAQELKSFRDTSIQVIDKMRSHKRVKTGGGVLFLKDILNDLAEKQYNEVHIEAGATLCGAFINEGLVDEIVIYMAPTLMGSNAKGLFNLPALNQMKDKIDTLISDIRIVGEDIRITMHLK